MGQLAQVLRALPPQTDPRVLVGTQTADDAGVFRIGPDLALVQTVDFFTPVVDDPYTWGAIAAANSLSDVYAMGGRPITALNVLAFPTTKLPIQVLAEVLRGSADVCARAGVAVLGGHTVDDDVPKFGLSVTGTIHPERVITNAGGREDDLLVLTKPIGLGIVNSGIRLGHTPPDLYERAVKVMTTLNRGASEAMIEVGAHAATDITGYGLIGHLAEMCIGSGLGAELFFDRVPVLEGVADVRRKGATTSAPRNTFRHLEAQVTLDEALDPLSRELLADPQTSGGLLIAVAPHCIDALHDALRRQGVEGAATVGRLTERRGIVVRARADQEE